LGLGYEEGRELPHQSAKCAPINEGDLLYFNKCGTFTYHAKSCHNQYHICNWYHFNNCYTKSTPDIIKQPSSSNCIHVSLPLSPFLYYSLIRRIFSKSTSVQIQSWNILLVRHFSPYAQEWLGFIHCLGYIQQSLGLITMMFQWYLR